MSTAPGYAVIFDTNAYRVFTYDDGWSYSLLKIDNLITMEKQYNIQAFANPFVMLELCAHLADARDYSYDNCKSSIAALMRHCSIDQAGTKMLALLMDPESQLCKLLHDEVPQSHIDIADKISRICKYIYENATESGIDKIRNDLAEIATQIQIIENQFISDVKKYVVQVFNPASTDWSPLKTDAKLRKRVLDFINSEEAIRVLARGLVYKTQIILNKVIDENDFKKMADLALSQYEAPLQLYNEIVRRIVMTGCDLTKKKRGNWIWDMQIAFAIGTHHALEDGRQVRLVTGDEDLVEAANKINSGKAIYSLAQYLNSLKTGTFS